MAWLTQLCKWLVAVMATLALVLSNPESFCSSWQCCFAAFRLYTDQLSVARRLDYAYGDSVQLKVDFLTEYTARTYGQCTANLTKCTPALSNKDYRNA